MMKSPEYRPSPLALKLKKGKFMKFASRASNLRSTSATVAREY